MQPFSDPSANIYFSGLYSSAAYYPNPFLFYSEDPIPVWNPPNHAENVGTFNSHSGANSQHLQIQELPQKGQTRSTRPRTKNHGESSVSNQSQIQQSCQTPEMKLRQKYGRNIHSNIFHHMAKKITTDPYFMVMVNKIASKNNTVITCEQFMEMLNKKVSKLRTYIGMKKMCSMWRGQKIRQSSNPETIKKEQEFCLIFRIISLFYLKNVHILHVFNGLKLKQLSKQLHINGIGKMSKMLMI